MIDDVEPAIARTSLNSGEIVTEKKVKPNPLRTALLCSLDHDFPKPHLLDKPPKGDSDKKP